MTRRKLAGILIIIGILTLFPVNKTIAEDKEIKMLDPIVMDFIEYYQALNIINYAFDKSLYELGTIKGQYSNPYDKKNNIYVHGLKIITKSGKYEIIGILSTPERNNKYRYVISPESGKYAYWQPIIIYPKKSDPKYYKPEEVKVIGYFRIIDHETNNIEYSILNKSAIK